MVGIENISKYLQQFKIYATDSEIKKILETQNEDEIKEAQEKRFSYKIWDKKSDINGVPAKKIIDSRNYEIGQAYLIFIDEKLVYFQDHNPNMSGYVKMTKKEAENIAQESIKKKVEEYVDRIILANIKKGLMNNG